MAEITIQDALEYCLANPDGLGVEELLARFPEYREELQPLLAFSSRIGEVAPPPVPAARRVEMKARLMEAATAQQQAVEVTQLRPANRVLVQPERKTNWIWAALRRPALMGAGMAALFVALVWWGAAAALPDSPFYNIKLASENFMLNFAGGTADKARAHLGLANTRLDDIGAMNRQGKLASAGGAISNYQEHMNQCAMLWKEAVGDVRDALKADISASVTRCEQTFKGFGTDVAALPEANRMDLGRLYGDLSAIRVSLGEPAAIDLPEGVTLPGAPDATPVVAQTAVATAPVGQITSEATRPSISPVRAVTGTAVAVRSPSPAGTGVNPTAGGTAIAVVGTATGITTSVAGSTGTAARSGVPTRARTTQATSRPQVSNTPVRQRTVAPRGSATTKPKVTRVPTNIPVPRNTNTPRPASPVRTPSRIPSMRVTPPVPPHPTFTHTTNSTATYTATPQATVPPTRVLDATPTRVDPPTVPPESTTTPNVPIPPTEDPVPTGTPVVPKISSPVPPTPEPEPTVAECPLQIEELEIESCTTVGTKPQVTWSAEIENESPSMQEGDWEAILRVRPRNGPYREADRLSGSVSIRSRASVHVGGTFKDGISSDTVAVRVQLIFNSNGGRCIQRSVRERDCEN